ncbi:MAG: SDR family NAD(P)-dependent oxidoreductase, partial [Chitinophagaceae bacterium]
VKVTTFEKDLTQSLSYTHIFTELTVKGLTADILINNVGLGNWSWFDQKSINFYKIQIDLNITSTVLLCRLFLDQIDKQNQSYILNVGSLGGRFIVPKKQVYGATKSFISYFTKCLQLEQAGSNVKISLLSPGGINTKPELLVLNHSLKGVSRATILEPDEVARIAINGLLKGKREIIPGLLNKVLCVLNHLIPAFLQELIIKQQLKTVLKA